MSDNQCDNLVNTRNNLKAKLVDPEAKVKYTKDLRAELLKSLVKRFGAIVEKDDLFKVATFLDPNFGLKPFRPEFHIDVQRRVKANLEALVPKKNVPANVQESTVEALNSSMSRRKSNDNVSIYVTYSTEQADLTVDELDIQIKEYRAKIAQFKPNEKVNVLEFWKANSCRWPLMAALAKIMLGVPASSANCERMFSLAGHIFSPKRRRTTTRIFEKLVFLKLNEKLM